MQTATRRQYDHRVRRVFASDSTWQRLIRNRGWRRPRLRVHPAKAKTGIRATKPNEWWHIDLTVIRLTSGAKVYLHAVIDNFARKILAWEIAERVAGKTTAAVLANAAKFLGKSEVTLMADSGVENVNQVVDDFLDGSAIKRVLAQVEGSESNSMIEAFWRSLRHQWLYLHELDSMEKLEPLVDFYVKQHNAVMPHSAFAGQTQDEEFFGFINGAGAELVEKRREARGRRIETNRSKSCGVCVEDELPSDSKVVATAAVFATRARKALRRRRRSLVLGLYGFAPSNTSFEVKPAPSGPPGQHSCGACFGTS